MKLGLLCGLQNIWHEAPRKPAAAGYSHFTSLLPAFYPDRAYATINYRDPDFSLFEKLDAVLYVSGVGMDSRVVDYWADIPCIKLVNPDGGYRWFTFWNIECIRHLKKIMDAADLIILPDERREYLETFSLFTETPLLPWLFPYPVESTLPLSRQDNSEFPVHSILIPYGPYQSQNSERNVELSALVAQKIIDESEHLLDFAIFDAHIVSDVDANVARDEQFLWDLGCRDFALYPPVMPDEFIRRLTQCEFVLNLDWSPAIGRVAADCALCRIPYIGTDVSNFGHYIYGDIYTQDPFDVAAAVHAARDIAEGKWTKTMLDVAYNRALSLNIADRAAALEEGVRRHCEDRLNIASAPAG